MGDRLGTPRAVGIIFIIIVVNITVRTNMKKRILACFLRAKRPIFKVRKNKSLRHQPT